MIDIELAQRVVDYLNDLLACDAPAIAALIANRIPCNETLANHPTCQVNQQHGGFHVGLLGVLNGLCGYYEDGPKKDWGAIAAVYEPDPPNCHRLDGFKVLENVEDSKPEDKPEVGG